MPSKSNLVTTGSLASFWRKLKGEGTSFGSASSTLRLANEFLCSHSLSEVLPYRSFDPETQVFINHSSVGFVIETLPLVGCGDEIPRQLTGLFQHALPLGSSFQCLLLGSHRTVSWVKTWENARSGPSEILKELAKERGAYLRTLSQGAHPSWSSVRTFRTVTTILRTP